MTREGEEVRRYGSVRGKDMKYRNRSGIRKTVKRMKEEERKGIGLEA